MSGSEDHLSRTPAGVPADPRPLRPFVVASAGPVAVSSVTVLSAPVLAQSDAGLAHVRAGGLIAGGVALLVCIAVGLWTRRACSRGGTAFLAPMAGGFVLKLAVLAAGTVLLAGPLSNLGDHVAFALSFAAGAFAFQIIFTPSFQRALKTTAA